MDRMDHVVETATGLLKKTDLKPVAVSWLSEMKNVVFPSIASQTMKFESNQYWNFLIDYKVVFGVPLLYLIAVYFLSRYMLDKEPLKPKGLMGIYNIIQILGKYYKVYI